MYFLNTMSYPLLSPEAASTIDIVYIFMYFFLHYDLKSWC